MRISRFLGITVCVAFVSSSALAAPSVNWPALGAAWQAYVSAPTASHADAITALLPRAGHVTYTNDPTETDVLDKIYDHLSALEGQIAAGKPAAVRAGFALYAVADGAFAEDLDVDLGGLIEKHPVLFLSALKSRGVNSVGLDGLVGNLGDKYVDRAAASCQALRARARILRGVDVPRLVSIRDKCIAMLDEEAHDTCAVAGRGGN